MRFGSTLKCILLTVALVGGDRKRSMNQTTQSCQCPCHHPHEASKLSRLPWSTNCTFFLHLFLPFAYISPSGCLIKADTPPIPSLMSTCTKPFSNVLRHLGYRKFILSLHSIVIIFYLHQIRVEQHFTIVFCL